MIEPVVAVTTLVRATENLADYRVVYLQPVVPGRGPIPLCGVTPRPAPV